MSPGNWLVRMESRSFLAMSSARPICVFQKAALVSSSATCCFIRKRAFSSADCRRSWANSAASAHRAVEVRLAFFLETFSATASSSAA